MYNSTMLNGPKDKAFINTKRMVLRPVETADESVLIKLWMDKDVRKYLGGTISRTKAVQRVKEYTGKEGFFCVTERESGKIIGLCSLDKYRTGDIEVSYQFFPEYWGKGFAGEAIKYVIAWGFKNMDLDHIIAVTQKKNVRSRNLLKKLGMIEVDEFIEFSEPQVMYSINNSALI